MNFADNLLIKCLRLINSFFQVVVYFLEITLNIVKEVPHKKRVSKKSIFCHQDTKIHKIVISR